MFQGRWVLISSHSLQPGAHRWGPTRLGSWARAWSPGAEPLGWKKWKGSPSGVVCEARQDRWEGRCRGQRLFLVQPLLQRPRLQALVTRSSPPPPPPSLGLPRGAVSLPPRGCQLPAGTEQCPPVLSQRPARCLGLTDTTHIFSEILGCALATRPVR